MLKTRNDAIKHEISTDNNSLCREKYTPFCKQTKVRLCGIEHERALSTTDTIAKMYQGTLTAAGPENRTAHTLKGGPIDRSAAALW